MPTTTQVEATLNINAIGARTDFAGTAVDDLSAEEIRYDQAVFQEGVLEPTDAYQVVAGGGGTMNVIVGSGSAKVDYAYVSGDVVGQGNYLVRLDDVTKTITLSAPDASQDRTDEIWLVVLDDVYDSSTKALPIFAVREGDVGGGAPGPDGSWQASLKLASVTVPGGSSDITEATITDSRVNAKMVVPAIEATDGTFNGVDIAAHAHTGAAGQGGDVDANDLLNLKTAVDAANVDADTVDGIHASGFAAASHVGAGGAAHADAVAGGADGFMTGADKSKLDGIESGATADQSASEILALIKTVDGSGSGLDADTVDGSHASSFASSGHGHAYVNESGDTMTGVLTITTGRTEAISLRSGSSTNNADHSYITFTSDTGNGALIRGHRYDLSTRMGIKLTGYNSGVTEAIEINYLGTTIFKKAVNVNGNDVDNVRSMSPSELWTHNNANGSLRWMGTGNAFAQAHTSSSEEHKVYIKEIDLDKSVFSRLEPIHFHYSKNHPQKGRYDNWDEFENPEIGRMGFSYEQVSEVAPHWTYDVDGMKAISYEGMLPDFMGYTTAAIQQLTARVSELEAQLEAVA